jgi:hypothetical protein
MRANSSPIRVCQCPCSSAETGHECCSWPAAWPTSPGLAGFSHNRDATKVELTHFDAGGLEDRIAVVREAAGDRFDAIELNALIQFVVHTDDRQASAGELAAAFGGISPEFVLDSPFVLLGTHEQMAEALAERQQRFGVSYWTVFDEWVGRDSAMPDIAKVIALLR